MTIINEKFIIHTKGNTEIKDITRQVQNAVYKHSLHDAVVYVYVAGHDGNGYAHVRASIIGNSTMVPLIDGALQLGQWQQIVLVDFDNKARTRTVYVQILY